MPTQKARTTTPWWVEGGQRECGFCARRYTPEVEYRCVACTAPVCPHCAVIVRSQRQAYCPGCLPEERAERWLP